MEKNKIIIVLLIIVAVGAGYMWGKGDNTSSVSTLTASKECTDLWNTVKSQVSNEPSLWRVKYDTSRNKCIAGHNDGSEVLVYDVVAREFIFDWFDDLYSDDVEKAKEWSKANKEYQKYFSI